MQENPCTAKTPATGRTLNREKRPTMEKINGTSRKPSVIRESKLPSRSMSEAGLSAANRLKMMTMEISSGGALFFANMPNTLLEQSHNMRIHDTVIHFLAFPPRDHQLHLAQPAHVMRHR